MKYTLEGSNARVIAKAVQSLSKVDKEMFIEIEQQGLQMRAINATQSAVGSIFFKRSMFEVFDMPPSSDFYCKISMKGCLAEFRAFLLFAECLNASLSLEFDDAGSPFMLKIKKHGEIECLLIMSTLSPDDVSFSDDYCQRDLTVEDEDVPAASSKRKSSTPGPSVQQKRLQQDGLVDIDSSMGTPLFQFRPSEAPSVQQARLLAEVDTVILIEDEAEEEALMLAAADAALEASQSVLPTTVPESAVAPAPPNSTEVCFYNTDDVPPTQSPTFPADDHQDDDESIPQSPERVTRMRTIFSRCFQSTYVPREPSPNSQAYAPNSDTED
ncbi:GL25252 [Drosophila persimilis]|uniref:GL25252 n=1 Tax=Drosophila persimilis TaxID=7234 RepID=B4GRR5_DROPE|nr:GL25252 [Drosophila persimilis]